MIGFVSPSGEFIECDYYDHIPTAHKLLKNIYKIESNNPVDKLCEFGWIVIQRQFVGFSLDDLRKSPKLTKQQIDFVENIRYKLRHEQEESWNVCLKANKLLYQ